MATENLKGTMATVDAMKSANKVLKTQYKNINISKIEVSENFILCLQDIQDEMEDLLEQSNEIQEVMGRSYGVPDDLDEDDLQAGKSYYFFHNFENLML